MAKWYAVYESATGRLVSTGTSVASDDVLADKGYEKNEYPAPLDMADYMWDATKRDFVLRVDPGPVTGPTFDDVLDDLGRLQQDIETLKLNSQAVGGQ